MVGTPGNITGGTVSIDLQHTVTSGLLIELIAPDYTYVIHNRTVTFPNVLRGPYDLGNLTATGAAGQWTLHISDHAEHQGGHLDRWSPML